MANFNNIIVINGIKVMLEPSFVLNWNSVSQTSHSIKEVIFITLKIVEVFIWYWLRNVGIWGHEYVGILEQTSGHFWSHLCALGMSNHFKNTKKRRNLLNHIRTRKLLTKLILSKVYIRVQRNSNNYRFLIYSVHLVWNGKWTRI